MQHLVVEAVRIIGETRSYIGGIAGGVLGYFAFMPQCSFGNILAGAASECHNWFGPVDASSEWFWPQVAGSIVIGCAIQVGIVSAVRSK
jgi:hypothetical protein